MENFGKFMAFALGIVLSQLISGFVTMTLWAWFIVPTFDANPLRLVEAIGMVLVLTWVFLKRPKTDENSDFWEEFLTNIIFIIVMGLFMLLTGWVITLFM